MAEARLTAVVDTKGADRATKELNAFTSSSESAEKSTKDLNKTTSASKKDFSSFGRSSGQAGIQLQQFIGQVQGGQSAMLALSQQSADLGFVLGAPLVGAVVGIGASIVGMALSATSAKNAMSELDKISADLSVTLSNSDGINVFTKQLERLAEKSQGLAKLQISSSIVDAQKQVELSTQAVSNLVDGIVSTEIQSGFGATFSAFDAINKVGGDVDTVFKRLNTSLSDIADTSNTSPVALAKLRDSIKKTSKDFDISEASATRFILAVGDISKNADDVSALKRFSNTLEDINEETGFSNEKIAKLAKDFIPLANSASDGVDKISLLRRALGDLNGALKESTDTGIESKSAVDGVAASLQAQVIALDQGAEASLRFSIRQSLGVKEGEKLSESIDRQIVKLFELKKAKEDAADEKRSAAKGERDAERLQAQKDAAQKQLEVFVGLNNTELEAIDAKEAARKEKIDKYLSDELITAKDHEKALTEIREKAAKDRQSINDKEEKLKIDTAKAAGMSLLATIQNTVDEQSGIFKAAAITETVINTYKGATAALAAFAGLGPAGFPLGIAAAGVITAAGLANVQRITAAREQGGQISAGQNVLVGERGPEIITSQTNARVLNKNQTSAAMSGGGGNQVSLVVIDQSTGGKDFSQETQDDGRIILLIRDTVGGDFQDPNSQITKGATNGLNVAVRR